jgi:hypothetical protein
MAVQDGDLVTTLSIPDARGAVVRSCHSPLAVAAERRRCWYGLSGAAFRIPGLKKLCCPTDRREPSSPMPAEPVTIKKIHQPTALQHRQEHLRHARRPPGHAEDFIVHDAPARTSPGKSWRKSSSSTTYGWNR